MTLSALNASGFNAAFPVGTKVIYRPVLGVAEFEDTKTRSKAWELADGTAVVAIDGHNGGIALRNLTVDRR